MSTRTPLSRRAFLKLGASAAGVAACPQIIPSGLFGATAANRRLNVAIVGCGNRSLALLPAVVAE